MSTWGCVFPLVVLPGLLLGSPGESALAVSPGTQGEQAGNQAAPPTAIPEAEVKAEFQAICKSSLESAANFSGRARLQDLRERLRSPIDDPAEEIQVRKQLGKELLEQGEPQQALAVLSEASRIASEKAVSSDLILEINTQLALALLRSAMRASYAGRKAECCILPIAADQTHPIPENGRAAGDLGLEMLKTLEFQDIRRVGVMWILNLARMISAQYPQGVPEPERIPQATFETSLPMARWQDRAPRLGVNTLGFAGGAVMDDFDGDGLLDLISSTMDPCSSLTAFRNDGRGGFEDVTAAWGLSNQFGGLNLLHADYDNDGRLDLLVLRGAWLEEHGRVRNSLLRNEIGGPRGGFVDVSKSTRIVGGAHPTQTAAWADYDGDGDLDLYVGNEASANYPVHCQLFRNDGAGKFTDVAAAAGVLNTRFTKAVVWGDYDNDGDPDLFVSNIEPNRLYRNNGNGTFSDVAPSLGLTGPKRPTFTSWFFDYDNDGDLDLFVAEYSAHFVDVMMSYLGINVPQGHPLLYRNDAGRFTEVSRQLGLTRPQLPMGANFGDLNNDGWLDFYLGTGKPDLASLIPNVMYQNLAGRRFVDVTFAGGFGHLEKGHGVAFGDLDNDGDQDLFHQLGGFYPGDVFYNALFENPGSGNAWITLRLEGRAANRWGLGARVEVRVLEKGDGTDKSEGRLRSIHRLVGSGGSFGGSSFQQEIGLGQARKIEEVVVRWPGSGTIQRFSDVEAGRIYRVIEGESELRPVVVPRISLGQDRSR